MLLPYLSLRTKKLLDCIFPAWVSEYQVHLLPPDLIYFAKRGFISTTTKGKGERWLFYGVVEASDCGATGQSLSAFVCLCFFPFTMCAFYNWIIMRFPTARFSSVFCSCVIHDPNNEWKLVVSSRVSPKTDKFSSDLIC